MRVYICRSYGVMWNQMTISVSHANAYANIPEAESLFLVNLKHHLSVIIFNTWSLLIRIKDLWPTMVLTRMYCTVLIIYNILFASITGLLDYTYIGCIDNTAFKYIRTQKFWDHKMTNVKCILFCRTFSMGDYVYAGTVNQQVSFLT